MNRLLRAALAGTLLILMIGVTRADIVYYTDHATKKEQEYRGTIEEENSGGIKIKLKDKKGTVKQVPAGAITWVIYETPDVDKVTYRQPFAKIDRSRGQTDPKKRTALLLEAMDGFRKLYDLMRGKPNGRRYIQWKMAELMVMMAQDDPTKTDEAIKLLSEYKKDNPGGWQLLPALKTLAKLQEETGKTDDARKTYEELAEAPDVPRELKQESEILVGRLLLRTGKFKDAEKRLEKLAGTMNPGDAQRPFVDVYLAESRIGQGNPPAVEKQLKDAIRTNSDTRLRGLAYNLLGDHYRKTNKDEEAFWSYLRVDAMYNEDAEEQAKALYYLSTLFDKQKKDPIRGKECADRLQGKRFAGTMYQKLLKPADDKKK